MNKNIKDHDFSSTAMLAAKAACLTSSTQQFKFWIKLKNNHHDHLSKQPKNLCLGHYLLTEFSISGKWEYSAVRSDFTVAQNSKNWVIGRKFTILSPCQIEYQPKKVHKGYSIFQMTVSGIFPYPNSRTAEKLFHIGVIPYDIIPHEELYCTTHMGSKT